MPHRQLTPENLKYDGKLHVGAHIAAAEWLALPETSRKMMARAMFAELAESTVERIGLDGAIELVEEILQRLRNTSPG